MYWRAFILTGDSDVMSEGITRMTECKITSAKYFWNNNFESGLNIFLLTTLLIFLRNWLLYYKYIANKLCFNYLFGFKL